MEMGRVNIARGACDLTERYLQTRRHLPDATHALASLPITFCRTPIEPIHRSIHLGVRVLSLFLLMPFPS